MSEPNTYAIINNPLLQNGEVVAQAVNVIQQTLATLGSYTPTEVNTFLDWSYDAGDIVTVEKDGETYSMPIFTNNLTWNGAHDIQWASSGNETRELPNVQERKAYGQGAGYAGAIQKVDDVEYAFRTYVDQTDEYIHLIATETDVQAAKDVGQSLFSITAGQIAAVVAQTGVNSTLERFDPDNAYAIGDQVAYEGVWYEFTSAHTAGDPWDPNEVKIIQTMQTIVTQAAGEVASYVEKTGIDQLGQDETLWSLIHQQAERIDLVVSGSGSEASIRIGQIVNGINSSGVLISADKISLNGTTSIAGDVTIDGSTYHGLHVSGIETGGLIATDLDVTHKFTMDDGTTCIFYNKPTLDGGATIGDTLTLLGDNGTYSLTTSDFPNVIKDAKYENNVLSLFKLDGSRIDVNFSSAATALTGGWSSGTYTATVTLASGDTAEVSTSPTISLGSWVNGEMLLTLVETPSSGASVSTGVTATVVLPTPVFQSGREVMPGVFSVSYEIGNTMQTVSGQIDASLTYAEGQKSISLVKDQWDGGILVVHPNTGTATPVTVQLSQGQGEWIDENNTKRYAFPIMDGQGSTGYTCKINTPTVTSVTPGNNPQRTGDSWFDTMTVELSNGHTETEQVNVSGIYNPGGASFNVIKGNWNAGAILFSPSSSGTSAGLELDTGEITFTSDGSMQIIAIEDSTLPGEDKSTGFSVYNAYPKATSVALAGNPTEKSGRMVDNATLDYQVSGYSHTIRDVDVTDIFNAGKAQGSTDTTLTGGWDTETGTYTVRATPQGKEKSISPTISLGSWKSGKMTVTLIDNNNSTGVDAEVSIPSQVSFSGNELSAGQFAITCSIGGTTRSGTCYFDATKSYEAGEDSVRVESLIKNGDATFSSNYKTVYIPARATASNGKYLDASINCKIDTAYDYAYAEGWKQALKGVVLDPDSNITISSEKTVKVDAYETPTSTSRTTIKSVRITPSSGGGGGGGGGGNVIYKVPAKTGDSWTVVNVPFSVTGYRYDWMPVQYNSYKGFMMAKYLFGTDAYYGKSTLGGCQGKYTSIPSAMQFNMTAQIRVTSGSTVNLRSSPS